MKTHIRPTERALTKTAMLRATTSPFERPDRLPRAAVQVMRRGNSLLGALAAAAARYPHATALVDDQGALTYRQLQQRTRALAQGLEAEHGAGPGVRIGLLARNSTVFVEGLLAAMQTGGDVVLLNTGFAGPQLMDVLKDQGVELLLCESEFIPLLGKRPKVTALDETQMDLLASTPGASAATIQRVGSIVMLTSGTTGRPKGASRPAEAGAMPAAEAFLSRVPLRLRDTQVIAAPLFHGWGLITLGFAFARSATVVLSRTFDPAEALRSTSEHRAEVLVVVPQMLQRILDLPVPTLLAHPTDSLRVIACSGGQLTAPIATRALARFGPVVYNMYGSTEVAAATIAGPQDLLVQPATVGRTLPGVVVKILDDQCEALPTGETGHVYVGSQMGFDGYTDGDTKQQHNGLINSGDLGHFNKAGRLFIDGREDDMIVSGGENVYPIEVETLLAEHPSVLEVAVMGAPDPDFGQALHAFIVTRPGRELTVDDVRALVKGKLARHKVPRHVTFLDKLPRNETGKVLRRLLH